MIFCRYSRILKLSTMSIPEIRKLEEAITMEIHDLHLRKVTVGKPTGLFSSGPGKVLMLVGETGTGKSTLINGMVNYIMGVKYEDKYRYKLVDDNTDRSQAHSQTTWITAYTFYKQQANRLPYTFTIIDTPGYGDTRGLNRDKEITKQIKEFFSIKGTQGIDHLNGIGFVVKASDSRLTVTQKYIFDSILSMFGKDFIKNIYLMVTFSDGGEPPVLAAVEEAKINYQEDFKFNNSALFTKISVKKKMSFDAMFWEMGVASFKDFFVTFNKAQSVSLKWTKEVLHEREHLECVIQGLQQNIQAGLHKAEQLHQEEIVIKAHESDLLKNKEFTYEIDVTKQRKVDLPSGEHTSNCLECNRTCHYPCYIPKNEDKAHCKAMGGTSYCEVCQGKCHWSKHVNNPYRFDLYLAKETKTSEDLKRRYYEAESKKTAAENVKAGLKKDLQNLYLTVFGMLRQAHASLRRLDEIALRPNPLSEIGYIDLLIESEKREAKLGFQRRIESLNHVREQAKIISGIKDEGKIKEMLKNAAQYCWNKVKFW